MDSGYHVGNTHQPARPQPLRLAHNYDIRISASSNPSVHHEYFASIYTLFTSKLMARFSI